VKEVTNSLSIPSGSSLWHVDIHGIRPGDLVKYKENGKIGLVIEKSVKESLNKISGYMKEDVVLIALESEKKWVLTSDLELVP